MRIFTPGTELPLAGHPTIGTTFALAHEGVIAPRAGILRVRARASDRFRCRSSGTTNGLSFAWMTQLLPTFGAQIADRAGFAAAMGLEPGDLEDLPIEEVSCGVEFLFVPVKTRAAVDRVEIDRRALARVYEQAKCDDLAVFFFTTDRTGASGDETVYSRMLAPQFGVAEDPATGGASGPLGSLSAPPRRGQRRAGAIDGQPPGRGHEASEPDPHLDRQRRRHDHARAGRRHSRCWWRRERYSCEVDRSGSRDARRLPSS